MEKIEESIAFFKMPESDMQKKIDDLYGNQLLDYSKTPKIGEPDGSQ